MSIFCNTCALQTELLRTDQQGFLKELDEGLLSRQPSESTIPAKRWRRCVGCCHACCLYRAALGFICTVSSLVLGLVLLVMAEVPFKKNAASENILFASGFFFAMGFFGTFSGITNLLANLSLFYGIPYLPGTGSVIVIKIASSPSLVHALCVLEVLNELVLDLSIHLCVILLCVVYLPVVPTHT